MNKSTREGRYNCPNCGAPIDGEKCPYCGTRFIDFAAMDTKDPFWIRVNTPGGILTLLVRMQSVDLRNPTREVYSTFAGDTQYLEFSPAMIPEITMRMSVLPVEDNVLYRLEKGDKG